jgi:hypothetical protein
MTEGVFAATNLKWVLWYSQTVKAYQLYIHFTWEAAYFESHFVQSYEGAAKYTEINSWLTIPLKFP